jgi:broad specificity phosphatase PhoE
VTPGPRHLWLVRHGLASRQEGRLVGHLDLPLSPEGEGAIAGLLRDGVARPDRVISSDLARARSSAQVLARAWGLSVAEDARLREMHFGSWEGLTFAEAHAASGAGFDAWAAAWSTTRVPEGEGFMDVHARVLAWWNASRDGLHGTTCIVGHGGSLRALLVDLFQRPLDQAFTFACDHAHVTVVRIEEGRPVLVAANMPELPR